MDEISMIHDLSDIINLTKTGFFEGFLTKSLVFENI